MKKGTEVAKVDLLPDRIEYSIGTMVKCIHGYYLKTSKYSELYINIYNGEIRWFVYSISKSVPTDGFTEVV